MSLSSSETIWASSQGNTDWLHCNRCQAHPRRGASLFLSNCGHLLCLSCKEKGARGVCLECKQAGVKYVAITENIQERTDIGHLFEDTEEQAIFLMKVLQFQKMHQLRLWEHWKEQERMQESERWSAEQLKEAEALDNDELKKRCQELEQVGVELQRVAELEHYIAQLRITIGQQEGVEQGPEFGAGPCKRPRNRSTESIPACSPKPLLGPSPQPHPSLPSHRSRQGPSVTCTSSSAYQMPPPRLPPSWVQRTSVHLSPSIDHSQSHYLTSDSMLQTRPVLQGLAREVHPNHPHPSSQLTLPSSMEPKQHGTAGVPHRTDALLLETRPSPRFLLRSGGGSKSPSPRTTLTPSPRGGIFGAAKISAPARRLSARSPSPRTSKPSPLVAARQSSSAHIPSPRTVGSDRGGLRITPNRLSMRGPPVGGRIGTVPNYVSPSSRVAELVRACGLKPLSPTPFPQLRPCSGTLATSCTSSLASVVCPTYQAATTLKRPVA